MACSELYHYKDALPGPSPSHEVRLEYLTFEVDKWDWFEENSVDSEGINDLCMN
jgi:hypothetical protein